jgi:hypothetical protein
MGGSLDAPGQSAQGLAPDILSGLDGRDPKSSRRLRQLTSGGCACTRTPVKRTGLAKSGRGAKKRASNGAKSNGWGGARPGAGRKPKGDVAGVSHYAREKVDASKPLRVTLKMTKEVPDLRSKKLQPIIETAMLEMKYAVGFKVLRHGVDRDRLIMIVEAKDTACLTRAMKSFNVRFARNVNRILQRTGAVLADRYDAVTLKTPRDMKRALTGGG